MKTAEKEKRRYPSGILGSIYIRWNSFLLYLGNKKLLRYAICDAVSIIGNGRD